MAEQSGGKLNYLERTLPEGLLVDAGWMERHGYSTSLRSQYVAAGWLTKPARGVYKRPLGELTWERVVISLQTMLRSDLAVGGRTALELQGFSHYLSADDAFVIHLYGDRAPPKWLSQLRLGQTFRFHRSRVLFPDLGKMNAPDLSLSDFENDTLKTLPGPGELAIIASTPERALLELLDELPRRESFHQADKLVEGMRTLSPRRLQTLLAGCKSIKVKRLFFWFAERHQHPWLKQIDSASYDLGKGKRMLVKGGKLDPKYLITVPEDLDAPV